MYVFRAGREVMQQGVRMQDELGLKDLPKKGQSLHLELSANGC